MIEQAKWETWTLIPTGALDPVAGTALDFTTSKTLGRDIDQLPAEIGGYDHNYVLNGEPGTMRLGLIGLSLAGLYLIRKGKQQITSAVTSLE